MYAKLPNILTYSRIVAIPIVAGFMMNGSDTGNWLAFSAYTYACITDFFDGYLARAWEQQSSLGKFLDPIADKLLVAAVLLVGASEDRILGWAVLPALVILCREILVSGLREFLAGAQVSVPVSTLAKWKTTVQMLALGFLIVGPSGPDFWMLSTNDVGVWGLWIAATLTLITGWDYMHAGVRHIRATDDAAAAAKSEEAAQ